MSDAPAASAAKHCESCGRVITPRRRWRDCWASIRYCSGACRRRGVREVDRRLEETILGLLSARRHGATICPSEAARAVASGEAWRELMEPARRAARRLVHRDAVEILQRGRVVDPSGFRGSIRIRARAEALRG